MYGIGILVSGLLWSHWQLYSLAQPQQELTPIPSLSPTLTTDQTAFEKLIQDNGECEFPCWWGFVLGKTKRDEWFRFLDQQAFTIFREDPLSNGTLVPIDYGYFSFPQSTSTSYLHYDFQEGMLVKVNLQLNEPNKWLSKNVTAISLPGLLHRLDNLKQNPEIYMFIGGTSSSLDLPFLIVANDIGVMAEYTFNISSTLSEPNDMRKWQYCLGLAQTTRIEITVQDPQISPNVSSKEQSSIEAKEPPHWVRLEDLNITPIDSNDFIQFFLKNPDSCYIPSNFKPEATKAS
jgi:hypothetical protein